MAVWHLLYPCFECFEWPCIAKICCMRCAVTLLIMDIERIKRPVAVSGKASDISEVGFACASLPLGVMCFWVVVCALGRSQ